MSNSSGSFPRILVMGAGVAGSASAIRLRQRGLPVTMVEKSRFPREKVCGCCVGSAGIAALSQLQVDAEVQQLAIPTNRWISSLADRTIELSLPSGIAISRGSLDSCLAAFAQQSGADVQFGCEARIRSSNPGSVEVTIDGAGETSVATRFDVVIVAAGLNAALQPHLPWHRVPDGPFGVAVHADCEAVEPGTIYMACDQDGYVGLVRLPEGTVDVAAALNTGSLAADIGSPVERMQSILKRSQFHGLQLSNCSQPMIAPKLRARELLVNIGCLPSAMRPATSNRSRAKE